jgi:hypothetical protein
VGIHADAFRRLVDSVNRVNGMPGLRRTYVPTPVAGQTAEQLRAYIDGDDPTTGQPFMAGVLDALTRPLDDADLAGRSFERTTPRFLDPDTEERLLQRFEDEQWTDHLPVVLPTAERVEAMLAGTSRRPDEVVGTLRPTDYREAWQLTVEKVAVNAVLAGARPEYLPVILAMAASGVTARHSSTSSFGSVAVVNGPIRREIAMNSGIGALGQYDHANMTIARAYSLLSQNLQGGSVPGVTYMGSVGNPLRVAFPEAEEDSPWRPLHVEQGFEPEQSVVSLYLVWGYATSNSLRETWREKLRDLLAGLDPIVDPLVILDPSAARQLAEQEGFTTKRAFAEWLSANAVKPARLLRDHHSWVNWLAPRGRDGEEPYASFLAAAPDEIVRVFAPERFSIVTTGGGTATQFGVVNSRLFGTAVIDEWR